jgi:hypothetical protein
MKLSHSNLDEAWTIDEFPTLLDAKTALVHPDNITELSIGSRLIPRDTIESNLDGLMAAARYINENGGIFSGLTFKADPPENPNENALNPAWRQSMFSATIAL